MGFSFIRGLIRLLLEVFYRQVAVVGAERIPASGPLILAANHHNSIVDAMLLLAVAPRPVVSRSFCKFVPVGSCW
jgi:1-acyl-sn-glycerol-3-phosphate acyltransferase